MLKYVAVAKILFREKAQADTTIFYLHYRISFLIFLISSLLVTAREYFGPPMLCTAAGELANVANTYCYFTSTFSVPKYWNETLTNRPDSIPYPGVAMGEFNDDEVVYHRYYQWVTFVLFLQAVMFYFPRYIWKSLEGGLFRTVLGGLDKFSLDESERSNKHKALVRYMMEHLHMHKMWSIRFFVCEALNLVNVVGQMYFTNHFLGGTFLTYGTDVVNFSEMDPENRVDPMTRIFPKMAKCTFRMYGPSGSLEKHDAFCLLAINIINEKIYIFIWFWLVILTTLTAVWLLYRLATLVSPQLRNKLLEVRGRAAGKNHLRNISSKCKLGDWFLVYQLGRHMEPTVYGEFLKELSKELENSAATLERKPMLSSS